MPDMRLIVGANIRKYREKLKLTQGELASRILVSFQAVSAWERGQSIPDLENANRLSEVLGVSVDHLLRSVDEVLYVGIDGGGTKTEFCAFGPDGSVKKCILRSASNPNDVGKDRCLEILKQGLEEVTEGMVPQRIFAGIAGAGAGDWKEILQKELSLSFHTEVDVDTDAANVLSLGEDPSNSAMVICGTGSCVFVRKDGKCHRVGGWGQLFDESGSAYDVGKDAVRHTLAVLDGLEEKSILSAMVEEKLGCGVWEAIPTLYEKGRSYIASLAPVVIRAYEAKDPVAEAILRKNAARLGSLLKKAMERFGERSSFIEAGGFFKNEAYRAMVKEEAGCDLADPGLPPVYGACVEALRRSEVPVCDTFRKKFIKTYGGNDAENRDAQ